MSQTKQKIASKEILSPTDKIAALQRNIADSEKQLNNAYEGSINQMKKQLASLVVKRDNAKKKGNAANLKQKKAAEKYKTKNTEDNKNRLGKANDTATVAKINVTSLNDQIALLKQTLNTLMLGKKKRSAEEKNKMLFEKSWSQQLEKPAKRIRKKPQSEKTSIKKTKTQEA